MIFLFLFLLALVMGLIRELLAMPFVFVITLAIVFVTASYAVIPPVRAKIVYVVVLSLVLLKITVVGIEWLYFDKWACFWEGIDGNCREVQRI